MSTPARLVLRHDPTKVAPLDPARPLTIGRAEGNRLRLPTTAGVAANHAVLRFSASHGWIVCDWQSGEAGTWLRGERVRQCRPLRDGDEIRLGSEGPVLVFQVLAAAAAPGDLPQPAGAPPSKGGGSAPVATDDALPPAPVTATPAQPVPEPPAQLRPQGLQPQRPQGHPQPFPPQVAAPPAPAFSQPAGVSAQPRAASAHGTPQGAVGFSSPGAATLSLGGRAIPLDRILSAEVRSRPRHPHSFSWWLLVCLGGLVLLPWPWLFWLLEALALVGWVVLGARREHVLLVTLRDGMAHRHGFANRITALSHRNGIRRAIGQTPEGACPDGTGSQRR